MRSSSASEITVSMEGFVFRDASPPETILAAPPDRKP
jgi:hypothetical protein